MNAQPLDSNHSSKTPGRTNEHWESVPGAGRLGMFFFIASLSMLFAASLIGYLAVRLPQENWPPEDMPRLPAGLWFSTAVILLSSAAIQLALRRIRAGDTAGLRKWLWITNGLGYVFLISQTVNWTQLILLRVTASVNLYAFTFFMLTGLHALHVLGGLIELGIVTRKAYRGIYTAAYHPGVEYSAIYWHFLDVVWIIMFALLVIAG
ncbi:MAG TPA: heme-copper oxidase subunit III [bacterium]|nr:heme-copper oxidase subunit III [Candidatus Omnitrophota bacterium]HOJ61667.1 heme-copper oxidase subunit III [bacterium]HOL96555.1 heme-copper oxidase subunit III [bacterium]HPP00695.1 heme-copper oxidase subunit III [bacterium]